MDLNSYQQQALQSVAITDKTVAALAHRTLGLTGEAGILANQLKKVIRDKDGQADEADIVEAKKRLGDVLYYAAVLADYFDLSLEDIAKQNLEQSTKFKQARSDQHA